VLVTKQIPDPWLQCIGTFWLQFRVNRVVEIVEHVEAVSMIGLTYWKVRDVLNGFEETVDAPSLYPMLTPLEVLARCADD